MFLLKILCTRRGLIGAECGICVWAGNHMALRWNKSERVCLTRKPTVKSSLWLG